MHAVLKRLDSNTYMQLQLKFEHDISVKIEGDAPSCNITATGTAATATPPPRGIFFRLRPPSGQPRQQLPELLSF